MFGQSAFEMLYEQRAKAVRISVRQSVYTKSSALI